MLCCHPTKLCISAPFFQLLVGTVPGAGGGKASWAGAVLSVLTRKARLWFSCLLPKLFTVSSSPPSFLKCTTPASFQSNQPIILPFGLSFCLHQTLFVPITVSTVSLQYAQHAVKSLFTGLLMNVSCVEAYWWMHNNGNWGASESLYLPLLFALVKSRKQLFWTKYFYTDVVSFAFIC